jgi:hypothetical protein
LIPSSGNAKKKKTRNKKTNWAKERHNKNNFFCCLQLKHPIYGRMQQSLLALCSLPQSRQLSTTCGKYPPNRCSVIAYVLWNR